MLLPLFTVVPKVSPVLNIFNEPLRFTFSFLQKEPVLKDRPLQGLQGRGALLRTFNKSLIELS